MVTAQDIAYTSAMFPGRSAMPPSSTSKISTLYALSGANITSGHYTLTFKNKVDQTILVDPVHLMMRAMSMTMLVINVLAFFKILIVDKFHQE